MELITLLALGIGLSFDTFAVSLSCGALQARISFRQALKVAFVMAIFQGGFPLAGYYLGNTFSQYVEPLDHWIAFALLLLLGIRMITEGQRKKDSVEIRDFTKLPILLALGVGTSIDAFVIGIGLGFLNANIWLSCSIIGVVTFMASMVAIRLGKGVGKRLGSKVEIAGGIILILIGLKIVMEHTLLPGV